MTIIDPNELTGMDLMVKEVIHSGRWRLYRRDNGLSADTYMIAVFDSNCGCGHPHGEPSAYYLLDDVGRQFDHQDGRPDLTGWEQVWLKWSSIHEISHLIRVAEGHDAST